jgi:hypothetical protein
LNFLDYNMFINANSANKAARIARDASYRVNANKIASAANSVIIAIIILTPEDIDQAPLAVNLAGQAIALAINAAYNSADAVIAAQRHQEMASVIAWKNLNAECDWLTNKTLRSSNEYSSNLTREKLWFADYPSGWAALSESATTRLLNLDPTYQVWIDWYNRRIEGHDAAFDIPFDTDRVHDKAILARLADATDEDFWGKGATYVNTTLQRWIDEARIEARIDQILRQLRSGEVAHYGAPEELAGRAALLDELDRLLGKSLQARHGIGGNHPPEPIDLSVQSVALPEDVREPLEAISIELDQAEPDALVVVEQVKLLHRVGRKLEKMAGLALDKYAEGFGEELGKGTAKLITRTPYLAVLIMLINQILDWLAPLIR